MTLSSIVVSLRLRTTTRPSTTTWRIPRLASTRSFAADLAIYRLDTPWWVPVNDPVNQLVFAETGASVETMIVDGHVVLDKGRVTTFDVDVDAMLREVREMFALAA